MHKEGFLAERVDEQIDQHMLVGRGPLSSPEVCVAQDLQGLYTQPDLPEQVRRSLDSIWSRLADQISPVEQTLLSQPEGNAARVSLRNDESASRQQPTPRPGQSSSGKNGERSSGPVLLSSRQTFARSKKRSLRSTLALSSLAAVVVLSVLSWAMVTRLAVHPSTRTGSGPGGMSTVTPIPATPAPQDLRTQTQHLLAQFHQEVTTWGQTHQYHDTYDGKSYALDYAYDQQGVGGVLDHIVQQAKSTAEYQAALTLIQDELTNLHVMQINADDATPYNQVHSADSSLLSHYKLNSGTVVVVSLLEQSLRVYQNGRLVEAFLITSGRYEAPTLPGSWQIFSRQTNVTLMSSYPKGSPLWFPPTSVHYVLGFHFGGYLIYDSWWRTNYGPRTNFPHHDSGGSTFANDGSGGSIELNKDQMPRLYNALLLNTPVVIY